MLTSILSTTIIKHNHRERSTSRVIRTMRGRILVIVLVNVLLCCSICRAQTPSKNGFQNRVRSPARALQDAQARKKERETQPPTSSPTPMPTAFPTKMPKDDKNKDKENKEPAVSPVDEQDDEEDEDEEDRQTVPVEATTGMPTDKPTKEPTAKPTEEPTASPTASPTEEPTASPTASPTAKPSASPTASPSASPSASPTSMPSVSPSSMPSSAPTIIKFKVVLDDFNVLLTSSEEINLIELDRAIENYLLEGMTFEELIRMELTVIEGDTTTSADGYVISTSVRFSGIATFEGNLPELEDIRAEQTRLLEAYKNMGAALDSNSGFVGVTVESVSFSRIDSSEPFKPKPFLGGLGKKGLGIVLGIACICVMWVVGIVMIVRLQRTKNLHKKMSKKVEERKERKNKKQDKPQGEDVQKGCASLVSGSVCLGNQDSILQSSARPDEISIHYTYDMDEDEAYLTMDEELRTYTDFSASKR